MSWRTEITHPAAGNSTVRKFFRKNVLSGPAETLAVENPNPETMKSLFRSAAALALLSSANATVLLNDTFSDGSRTNASLPSSGAWVMTGSGVGTTGTSTVVSGALVSQSNSGFALTTAFGSQPLGVGETITLTFSVTLNYNGTASSDAFRFGIFNSGGSFPSGDSTGANGSNSAYNAWTGYSYWSPFGTIAGANTTLRERTGTDFILYASGANTNSNSAAYTSGSIANSTYSGSFSITNNGSSLAISSTLGGNTQNWTDTSPSATTFDSISFFAGSTPLGSAGSFTLDNVMVEIIPEPSSLLFAAIAPLALLRRRR